MKQFHFNNNRTEAESRGCIVTFKNSRSVLVSIYFLMLCFYVIEHHLFWSGSRNIRIQWAKSHMVFLTLTVNSTGGKKKKEEEKTTVLFPALFCKPRVQGVSKVLPFPLAEQSCSWWGRQLYTLVVMAEYFQKRKIPLLRPFLVFFEQLEEVTAES